MYKLFALFALSVTLLSFTGMKNTFSSYGSNMEARPADGKPAPVVYKVDKDSSLMVWYCQENMNVHSGGIPFLKGAFTLNDGKVSGGSFELDMFSIGVNDLKNNAQKKQLVQKLVAKDLFNCTEFPTAKFVITTVTPKEPTQYLMEGNMTIKGITRVITIPMQIILKNNSLLITSPAFLVEGAAFGLKTGVIAGNSKSELRNFRFKISQLYASKKG